MINSKAIKNSNPKWTQDPDDYTFFRKLLYNLKEWIYHPIVDFFDAHSERSRRAAAYAKFGYNNYDYDLSYVYKLMNFKFKRLYKALEEGHVFQEDQDMKALQQVIKLTNRLAKCNYEWKYHRAHDRKWGKIESKTEPNYDLNGKIKTYTWISWRKTTKEASEEVKKQERDEFMSCYEKGEADRRRDIDTFATILKEHGNQFWD